MSESCEGGVKYEHLFHQLQHVFLLHRVHPELLQLLASATEQLLARIQVLLDRMDALSGGSHMPGHGSEELHDLGEISIVPGHELIEHLIRLPELPLDLLLLLLALLICLAGV